LLSGKRITEPLPLMAKFSSKSGIVQLPPPTGCGIRPRTGCPSATRHTEEPI
jgi:hypothetical protein